MGFLQSIPSYVTVVVTFHWSIVIRHVLFRVSVVDIWHVIWCVDVFVGSVVEVVCCGGAGMGVGGDCYQCVGHINNVGWGSGVLICGVDADCFVVGCDDGGVGIGVVCTDDCDYLRFLSWLWLLGWITIFIIVFGLIVIFLIVFGLIVMELQLLQLLLLVVLVVMWLVVMWLLLVLLLVPFHHYKGQV